MAIPHDADQLGKATRLQRGFLIHLAAYTVVNVALVGINLALTPQRLWFVWPLAGWGAGLLAHGAAAWFAARR